MQTHGKIIVITGGTSGIGYEMVKMLYEHNQLIVIGRNAKKLQHLTQTFKNITPYQADLSNLEAIKSVGTAIARDYPTLDILINNAAVQNTPRFTEDSFDYDTIAQEINLNFTSICSLSSLFLPSLLKSNHSIILNINSGLALAPKTSSAIYSSTKSALNSFTLSLRYQLTRILDKRYSNPLITQ